MLILLIETRIKLTENHFSSDFISGVFLIIISFIAHRGCWSATCLCDPQKRKSESNIGALMRTFHPAGHTPGQINPRKWGRATSSLSLQLAFQIICYSSCHALKEHFKLFFITMTLPKKLDYVLKPVTPGVRALKVGVKDIQTFGLPCMQSSWLCL